MNKIIVSAPLLKFTNNIKSLDLSGDSYFNLYTNLANLFPDLQKVTNQLKTSKSMDIWMLVDGKVLSPEHVFLNPKKNATIVIVPLITGSGGDIGMIALGVAMIAVAIVFMQPQFAIGAAALGATGSIGGLLGTAAVITSVAGGFLSLGASMLLSGILGALNPPSAPKAKQSSASNDNAIRGENGAFDGLRNTTSTQTSIPLIYGHHRVPGQFINGKIKSINHDQSTIISVANYV